MGKIRDLPNHNDSSYDANNFNSNRLSGNDNRMLDSKGSNMKGSLVPIHEVGYNPQFSKSPLASYEMGKEHHAPTRGIPMRQSHTRDPTDIDYHVGKSKSKSSGSSGSKCDWKKMLCCLLATLALIGLAVGLYFLIDTLLSKDSNDDDSNLTTDGNGDFDIDIQDGIVRPIELNPIPYDAYSSQYGTASNSDTLAGGVSTIPNMPNTFPTKPNVPKPSVPDVPNYDWDSLDNSISPIDVYGGAHH